MITEQRVFKHPFFGETYYLLQRPETPGPHPMIVFLHGAGERGKDYSLLSVHGIPRLISEGREVDAVVLSPQCPEEFVWVNLVQLLKALIDEVASEVKPTFISITGLSMGGYGTWEMVMTYPGLFRKAAPICGGGTPWRAYCVKCPVWAFHGDADTTVPVRNSVETVDAVKNAGGDVRLTLFHGVGHDSWNPAYRDTKLIEWLCE